MTLSELLEACIARDCIGLDTSSGDDDTSYLAICCFKDAESGYAYLEKHLQLPKAKQPKELKWRKIDSDNRDLVLSRFGTLLNISCDAILLLKTNALKKPEEKLSDIFIKLIAGSFSGYEHFKGDERTELKRMFFSLVNNTPVHFDSDFSPLSTDKIVRFLVRTLADGGRFLPLHVGLRSEESHPIQVADIICGSLKTLSNKDALLSNAFRQIPFDDKLKGGQKFAKTYYWTNQKTTQVSKAVNS